MYNNNNNNFNTCSKCGTPNPLMGRFCYQCGSQLRAPQDPIVCTKCNTVNVSGANFCKRCGSKLTRVQTMKYCPQCYTAIPSDSMFCPNCRYDYNTNSTAKPQPNFNQIESNDMAGIQQPLAAQTVAIAKPQPIDLKNKNDNRHKVNESDNIATIVGKSQSEPNQIKQQSKPRLRFLFLILFSLAFVYFAALPVYKWSLIDFGTFTGSLTSGTAVALTGYELVINMLRTFGLFGAPTVNSIITTVLGVAFALSAVIMVVYVLICLVRLCMGKGCIHVNWAMLAMAVVTGIVVTIVATSDLVMASNIDFLKNIYSWFLGSDLKSISWGYNLLALPVGFLLLFMFSIIFKVPAKKRPAVLDITRPI